MITAMDIEAQLKKVERDVRILKQKIDEHVGDYGTDVHAAAQNGIPGFMSGLQAQQFVGTRTYLGDHDDGSKREIEFIENGFWYSNSNYLSGLPESLENTDALILLDVYNYGGGRKQIKVIEGWNNRTWTKDFHSPSGTEPTTSLGWILQSGSVLLWSGAQNNGTLNFTGNKKYYQYLVIMYRNEANNRYATKVLRETNSLSLTTENVPDDNSLNVTFTETTLSISDTSITFGKSRAIMLAASSAKEITGNESEITITTVLGVNG